MKRAFVALLSAGVMVAVLGGPAVAHHHETPRHPHMLVLGVQFQGGEPVGFRKCVDVAGNRALPLNAHHDHLHTGRAGQALFMNAGHVVVPGAPITPWRNCAELIGFFFGD
jgi:hypothetical protein